MPAWYVPVVLADGRHREPIVTASDRGSASAKAASLTFGSRDALPGAVPVVSVGNPRLVIEFQSRPSRLPSRCADGRHRWDFRDGLGWCTSCGRTQAEVRRTA